MIRDNKSAHSSGLDWREKAVDLLQSLDVNEIQSRVYLHLIENGIRSLDDICLALKLSDDAASTALNNLLQKGCIIEDPIPSTYTPLHPRMALTNVYNTLEEKDEQSLRMKRLLIDQISFLLEGIYEKRMLG